MVTPLVTDLFKGLLIVEDDRFHHVVSGDKSFQVVLLRKVMSKKLALCDEILQVSEPERSNIT